MSLPIDHNFTIVIPNYNCGNTITRAVNSVLMSSEVSLAIIVDDASTDNSVSIIKDNISDPRLRIFSLSTNHGPSVARNFAIKECLTPWIGVLDADDFFLPDRLKDLLQYSNQADLIADDIWRVIEENIDGPRKLFLGDSLKEPRLITFQEFVSSNISNPRNPRGELGFIKPIIRRSFLEKHRLKYQEHMRLGEDYELYARALALGAKMLLIPTPGYVSVVRANSLSGQHTIEDLKNLRDCDLELAKIPGLTTDDKTALRQHYLSIDCRLQWRLLIAAVKERNFANAFKTFMRPYPVPFYLIGQLFEQLIFRVFRKLRPT